MLQGYRCQYRGLNRRSTATSLISWALILIATLQQWQRAAVAAIPTTSTATTRQTTRFANPAKYDDEATQNYYRIRAGDSNEQMATTAASAATYANYLAATTNYNRPEGEEEVSATLITRDDLAALHAASRTNTEFMPTTLTAAGQHYAEAAATPTSTNNDYVLLLGEEYLKLPTGDKIDYDKINSDSYKKAHDSSTIRGDEAYQAHVQHQQHQQQQLQHFGHIDDELRDYVPYQAENDGQQQHYLHDYQREQFSNYQQHDAANHALNANSKQQQRQHLNLDAAAATSTTTNAALNYANQQQFHVQMDQQEPHQDTASSQLQVQVTDSNGRSLLPPSSSSATVADHIDNDNDNERARRSSLYNYQDSHQAKSLSNDLELTPNYQLDNDLQHMQHQLQQKQQRFAQLQLQLQQHDIQLQHQHHHLTLPTPTNIVHHTAASAAAVAGIPLAKHVHVSKSIPMLSNYQQQLVPFKQKVPIEIPRPVITTVPHPFPIHIPMTKTVAVPQMKDIKIPIEKIKPFPVERSVPYIVERRVPYRVEKQVAKPYYFPYPVKVPVVKTIVHRKPHSHQHHQHLHFPSHNKQHILHNLTGLY